MVCSLQHAHKRSNNQRLLEVCRQGVYSDEAQADADAQPSAREGGNDAKMTRGSIISSTVMCILMDEIILYFILGSFYNIEFAYLLVLSQDPIGFTPIS